MAIWIIEFFITVQFAHQVYGRKCSILMELYHCTHIYTVQFHKLPITHAAASSADTTASATVMMHGGLAELRVSVY